MTDPILVLRCPVCEKEFVRAPYHVYRLPKEQKSVCSYHCMRLAQTEGGAGQRCKKTGERSAG